METKNDVAVAKSVRKACDDLQAVLIDCDFVIHARLEGCTATRNNILMAIRQTMKEAIEIRLDDTVIIPVVLLFFAGQGVVEVNDHVLCTAETV